VPSRQELAAFKARLLEAVQLLERRLKMRLTGTDLARRWKLSQPTVSRYLEGKAIPPRAKIKVIALDCGVDAGWLDYGTTPAKPSTRIDDEEEKAVG
jgi:transcriptional regulator with XRE-family HTH domain